LFKPTILRINPWPQPAAHWMALRLPGRGLIRIAFAVDKSRGVNAAPPGC